MSTYRGESDSKQITREFVWSQHQRILGASFYRTPKVFLASRVCGDTEALTSRNVPWEDIWAVERDPEEYLILLQRKLDGKLACRVFQLDVETVIARDARGSKRAPNGIHDVYLDFCGTVQGMKKPIQKVLRELPRDSVVSVTLNPQRELEPLEATRETTLTRIIQAATPHRVTLVQSIHYKSGPKTPMETWTFAIGCDDITSRGKMRFDLTTLDVASLAKSPSAIKALWEEEKLGAERRSLGAVKANQSRRQGARPHGSLV